MVESRWLRWIGPGVVAIGAVGLVASATAGAAVRPWAPRACAGPPGAIAAAAGDARPADLGDLASVPWFRRIRWSTAPASCAASASRSASTGTGWSGPWTCPPNRSPRGRSAGSSWSDPMTGRPPGSWRWTSPAAAHGRSRRSAMSSGGRPSTRPGHRSSRCAWIGSAVRTWDLAPADRRPSRSSPDPRSHRHRRSVRPHLVDRVHVVARGRPARHPVMRGGRLPDAHRACGWGGRRCDRDAARRAGPRTPRRRGRRRRRDLRRVSRSPLPDLRHGREKRWPAHARDRRGRSSPGRHAGRRAARPRGGARRRAAGCRRDRSMTRAAGRPRSGPERPRSRVGGRRCRAPRPTLPPGWVLLAPDGRLPSDPTAPRPILRHLPDGLAVPLDEAVR